MVEEQKHLESKQATNLHSAPSTATSIALLLASPDCLHAESPVTDETEQNYLTQLGEALAKGEFDDAAYSQLFTRLEAENLSLAALYRFANLCYQYWQNQWPTASSLQTNQAEIGHQTAQLQAMAQGRTLFRRSGTPTRYYWGRTNASGSDATEKGLFFACYPTFAAQGESVKAIYHAELITDVAHIVLCETHTQVQRRQQSFSQLLQHSSLLHQRLQQHGHHAKIVVNLQLAWLYYRSGPVMRSVSIHETGQAVFYFRQAMGQIARHTFIQQQPALPATLITAAEQVRERIDQAMLDHAQQTLFAAQSATLITRWQQCYQDAQLEVIYQLSQQTHALFHAVSVPLAAKQPLIDTWLAGFNRGLAGEDEQEVRVAMQSAITRACNPVQKYPHSLATVHQWLLAIAQQLQQHSAADRARALLHAYQQLLIRKRPNLQQTIASTDQDKAPYIATFAACEQALTELDQWFKTTNLAAETKESKKYIAPAIKLSAFAQRSEQIHTWHQTLAQSLAANTKTSDIYTANTEFARTLLANICREIEQQIGPAPCAYTLLGAGSFSRGEISLASDLDCALLVADASVKTVDEDNSNKVTFHPWFQCFLQLVQWKLASLPESVLSLESETLAWISKGYWFDTPTGFIEQHLNSQQPNKHGSLQQPENFGAQWFRWIYSSENQAPEKDTLLRDYQQRLQRFFHSPIDANSLPAYRQLAPWSLAKHAEQPITPSRRQLSLIPQSAPTEATVKEAKKLKESKHAVKVSANPASTAITFTVLNVKNLSYRLINAILCYGRFYDVPSGITTTRDVLAYLKGRQCLPPAFIARLETALDQLYAWRLRQHWAWLHHTSELGENEVVLWPKDTTGQAAIQALPANWRGFYLDRAETEQYLATLHYTAEVIGRSVEGFAMFAAKLPTLTISPVEPNVSSLSPSLFSSSTTTTSEVKEAKREVSEEEAQRILAAQSRAAVEAKAHTQPSAIVSQSPTMAETPAPSHAVESFNPLAVAVQWTLQQLAKSKDDKASTAADNKARTEHITWLAQVMCSCAEELPTNEPHDSDPLRVKQDPLFRKHWQVYWAIPTTWRGLYIQQLRQSSRAKAATIVEPLTNAPNKAGWRLSTQISEQRWQQALRPLFAAEPQNSLPPEAKADIAQSKAVWVSWVDQNTIRWAPLRQECTKVLIDAKQQCWQPQHNVHGNHRLYTLQTPSHSFWVKAYPEQPGTEYLVTTLDRRLGVNGTPSQQLMALHHAPLRVPDGTPEGTRIEQSAVLLSQHVADAKCTLHQRIKNEPQFLEKLDFLAFAKTLLRVLLTNPEDDKGSDYFLVPLPGTDRYQLMRIDNERAFLPVTHLTQSTWSRQEELQVKSILYCLDQMLLPWDSDPRTAALLEDFHQLQPSDLIIDLLKDIEQQHTHWQQLFPESSMIQHTCLQDPWISVPSFILPHGLEKALLKRFSSLQTALRLLKPQAITGLKLLELVQPKLAQYYNLSLFQGTLVRDPQQPQANVQARFEQVAGAYYQQPKPLPSTMQVSDYQTSAAPGPMVLSRQLSIALPALLKIKQEKDASRAKNALIAFARSIWSKQAYSVQQALTAVTTWQHLQAEHVMKGLLALDEAAPVRFSLLPVREQQQILDQLLSNPAMPLSVVQQQFLLTALVGAQCHDLNLTAFKAALSDTHLETILKASGQQVIALNISGCSGLTPAILKTIEKCCPHLKRLRMNFQPGWSKVAVGGFANLTILECEHATLLTQVHLGALPKLRRLSLAGATALRELTDQGFGWMKSAPWSLPALRLLNVLGCEKLQAIKVHVSAPEQLTLLSLGCKQLKASAIEPAPTGNILTDELAVQFYPDGRINNEVRTKSGETALLVAAAKGQLATVQWLLDHGGASLAEKDNEGDTALLVAAYNGQLETVQWLLAHGALLAEKDNDGDTALLVAAYNGQLTTVQWLLDHGASLAEKNNNGDTALLRAADNGQLVTVQWLLDHVALLGKKNNSGTTPLLWAASNGRLTTMQWLLAHGASLTEKDNLGDTALLVAAYNGQLETVQWLLTHGASPTEKANDGNTALLWAAYNGQLATVQWLLTHGGASPASPTEKANNGTTALLWAAYNGQLATVQWLLTHGGASPTEKAHNGTTALLLAAYNGHLATVKWLLAHGASPASPTEKANNGTMALLYAAANGQLATVQWLLTDGGASPTEKANDGTTALLLAAANGHLGTVKLLLDHGASLSLAEKNNGGNTALLLAATNGHLGIVKLLLGHGASLAEKDNYGNTALLRAAIAGQLATVQWLLDHGASLAEKNNNDDTALLLAAVNGRLATVQWLLAHGGASPTEKDNLGDTALLVAAANGHLGTVKLLLDHGASPTEKDNKGNTALLLAAVNGHLDTVRWLLDHGAPPTEKANNGTTALLAAAAKGHLPIVQCLLARGASLVEKDNESDTALLRAANNGHLDTVQWLLTHGASLTEKANDGNTALLLAAANGHLGTVQWLLTHGATLAEKDNNGNTALLAAAANGHLPTVQWLLTHSGATLIEKTHLGTTVLLKAMLSGSMETVQFCLQKGLSLVEKNNEGTGAFLYAAFGGQIDMMKWLLTQGFSLTDTDNNGMTALLCAAKEGKLQAMQWLLAQGASWTKDKEGNTALILAIKEAQLETVKWLLTEEKAMLAEKNAARKTALEVAINLAQEPSDKIDTYRRIVHTLVAAYQAQRLMLPEVAVTWLAEPGNKPRDNESVPSPLLLADKKEEVRDMPKTGSMKNQVGKDDFKQQDLKEKRRLLADRRAVLQQKQTEVHNAKAEKELESLDQAIHWIDVQLKALEDSSAKVSSSAADIKSSFHMSSALHSPQAYQELSVPGDGDCLYSAVALYVGQTQQQLRNQVADELERKLEEYKPFLELKPGQTAKDYIAGVRRRYGEWAGQVEIRALMNILRRPIIVVRPGQNAQDRLQNPDKLLGEDLYFSSGRPIPVKYNGHNHYDAIVIVENQNYPLESSQNSKTHMSLATTDPPAVASIDSAPTLGSTTAPLSVPQKPPTLPRERKVEVDVENPPPSSQPKSSLLAPHSQFFIPSSPVDEKAQLLFDEVRKALDRTYPRRMVEHSGTRRAYLTQLVEYQPRSDSLNKAEQDTLRQLLAALQEVITQRNAAQSPATSTTTMQNQ